MNKITTLAATLLLALAGLAPTQAAHAQQYMSRYIYANSVCAHPIRMMVYHKDSYNNYHTHGWYYFKPYEESRLKANDVVLRQLVGYDLYVYAETDTRYGAPSLTWAKGDTVAAFEGTYYNMTRVNTFVDGRGDLEFKLSCA